MKPQVSPDHYNERVYDSKHRFISYWHQIHEIISSNPKEVLEIGIGNGFVHKYLRSAGITISTLDFDIRLFPDVVGSILNIPFKNNSFNTVACYELVEHLPYDQFADILHEMKRISNGIIIISLPDITSVWKINIELPIVGGLQINKLISHPFHRGPTHIFDGQHYWVIGAANYPLNRIEKDIVQCGLEIIETYRIFEFYWHRFFVLKKSELAFHTNGCF